MENKYLTGIPQSVEEVGLCKTFLVRREVIHWKHIMTEIFVRNTIDMAMLDQIGSDLFKYMEYMTGRLRKIHHFPRDYRNDIDNVIKSDLDSFFPAIDLYYGLNNAIALDFDGTVTSKNFGMLYELCCERGKTVIVTANPTVNKEWFGKHDLTLPDEIHACKGKIRKIKRLLELNKKYDNVFYVDNEIEYLQYAWIFGVKTFHYTNGKIKYFTMKTK